MIRIKQNRYFRLVADTGIFAFGNLLSKLIQLLLLPLYTSLMSTAEYGTADLLNNTSELLLPIITLCIYEAVFRFAVDKDCNYNKLLSNSLQVMIASFAIVLLAATIAEQFIQYEYTWYLVFILFSYSLRTVIANFVRGIGHVKRFAASGIINAAVLCLSNILLLSAFHLGVRGFLISYGVAYLVSTLFLIFASKLYKNFHFEKLDIVYLKLLLVFSIPMIFNNVSWWVVNISGRYVIMFFCGASMAGIYAASIKLTSIINTAVSIFQQAWQLNASRELANSDREVFFSNIFKVYSALVLMLGSLAVCMVPLLAKIFLQKEFYSAKVFLPMMLLTAIFNCYDVYFGIFYTAFKKNKMLMISTLVGAAINLSLCFILVPHVGVWGAVIASNISYLTIVIIRMIDTKRFVHVQKDWKVIIPSFVILAIQILIMSAQVSYSNYIAAVLFVFITAVNFAAYKNNLFFLFKRLKP